jgi:hypothetical protein
MNPPIVTCDHKTAQLTITIWTGSWNISRDVFLYLVDALKDKAWQLSGGDEDDHDDAVYVESIADAIRKALEDADDEHQAAVRNVFG